MNSAWWKAAEKDTQLVIIWGSQVTHRHCTPTCQLLPGRRPRQTRWWWCTRPRGPISSSPLSQRLRAMLKVVTQTKLIWTFEEDICFSAFCELSISDIKYVKRLSAFLGIRTKRRYVRIDFSCTNEEFKFKSGDYLMQLGVCFLDSGDIPTLPTTQRGENASWIVESATFLGLQ